MSKFSKTFFLIAAFSLAILSGCSYLGTSQQTEPAQTPEVQPPPTVVVDGVRTSYADVVQKTTPAVVSITAERTNTGNTPTQPGGADDDTFQFPFPNLIPRQQQPRVERGIGSGVIVSADGTVLTNHHVIEGADKIQVEMNDGKTYDAKIVGSDPPSDMAVLKIEAANLPFLTLGNSDNVNVGDIILAIGNPLGVGQSVTSGIISAKGRRTGLSDGTSFQDFLQIDAPINRGNSGGALVNLTGELIGINSQILAAGSSGGNIGIGFAIPSNMAKNVMQQLLDEGTVRRGQLGVGIQDLNQDLAQGLGLPADLRGVLVNSVREGSAAEKAGFKRGDIIKSINGERVEDSNVLRNKVAGTRPGTEIKVTVLRDGNEMELSAVLDELKIEGNNPQTPQQQQNNGENPQSREGKLGVRLDPLTPDLAARLQVPANTQGLVVSEVNPGGAAANAGISRGDIIQEINRQTVSTLDQARQILDSAGDKPIVLLVNRRGQTIYVTVRPS